MCHTSCFEEDAGSLEDYMSTVKNFLDGNPNEVIMMLLVNGDGVDPSMFDDALIGSGLNTYNFTPSSGSDILPIDQWPTLDTMITDNQRLVLFLGKHPNLLLHFNGRSSSSGPDSGANTQQYPYILDEFSYFFETPYDTTDPSFPECTIDRPAGGSPTGRMYIVNHFLDTDLGGGILVPNEPAAGTTNAATGDGSIGAQSTLCEGIYGYAPKGVLVDYMDMGDVFTAEHNLNGLSSS